MRYHYLIKSAKCVLSHGKVGSNSSFQYWESTIVYHASVMIISGALSTFSSILKKKVAQRCDFYEKLRFSIIPTLYGWHFPVGHVLIMHNTYILMYLTKTIHVYLFLYKFCVRIWVLSVIATAVCRIVGI